MQRIEVNISTGEQRTVDLTQEEIDAILAIPAIEAPIPNLSFAQLLIGLVTEGWITEAEGTAWLQGTVPSAVSALIASLPEEQRFIALARATRPSEVLRTDSLVIALGTAEGKTEEEMDNFFRTYAGV